MCRHCVGDTIKSHRADVFCYLQEDNMLALFADILLVFPSKAIALTCFEVHVFTCIYFACDTVKRYRADMLQCL